MGTKEWRVWLIFNSNICQICWDSLKMIDSRLKEKPSDFHMHMNSERKCTYDQK